MSKERFFCNRESSCTKSMSSLGVFFPMRLYLGVLETCVLAVKTPQSLLSMNWSYSMGEGLVRFCTIISV